MDPRLLVGCVLLLGLVVFLVGALAWRMSYEQPFSDAARLIHADRRRRAWIHVWMIVALFVSPAGMVGFTAISATPASVVAAMAAAVYALGAVCWITALVFRLTVVPWAAEHAAVEGSPPDGFAALDAWAGLLYVVHMAASYAAFAILGAAILASGVLPGWLGWLGIAWGTGFLAGFVVTRFSGPFNPPWWAHSYTAVVGITLLIG